MADHNHALALLLAVTALEGAHAAYLRSRMTQKLPTDQAGLADEQKFKSAVLLETLIREAGIHTLHQLTPFLLMSDDERPSKEQLIACRKGINIRNEFVHAKPSIKNRTPADLFAAYTAVMKVYECFVAALEKSVTAAVPTPVASG